MGIQTKNKNSAICTADSTAASRATKPMITEIPAPIKADPVKYAQNRWPGIQFGMSEIVSFTSMKWARPKKINESP